VDNSLVVVAVFVAFVIFAGVELLSQLSKHNFAPFVEVREIEY